LGKVQVMTWSPQARAAAAAARKAKGGAGTPSPAKKFSEMTSAERQAVRRAGRRPSGFTAPLDLSHGGANIRGYSASNSAKANVAAHIPPIGKAKPTTAASIASKVSAYHSHVEANGPIVAPNLYYGGGAFPSSPLTSKSGAQYSQWKKRQQAKGVKFRPVTNDLLQHKSSGWGMGGG